jgi:hypothetical protein
LACKVNRFNFLYLRNLFRGADGRVGEEPWVPMETRIEPFVDGTYRSFALRMPL